MLDITTVKPRRVRPTRPKPLPLYLRAEWRAALKPVEAVWASPTFRARIEAIQVRQEGGVATATA